MHRSTIVHSFGQQRKMYLDHLRKLIVEHDRIDVLAQEVLGYQIQPFHLQMLQFQFQHKDNLQLTFRGAGKSTMCTVTKAIHYMVKYPKIRMVIASKTKPQAMARLREIKGHLENNELLIELFGEFREESKDEIWNASAIQIAQRFDPANRHSPGVSANDATPTIMCVGAKGSIAGFHFDTEFSDDLVDKTNSDTEVTREELKAWYNGTFTPMLDPPDPSIPFRFDRHRVGTRYHPLDQYQQWIDDAQRDRGSGHAMAVNIIRAIDPETGKSPWPERFSVDHFERLRRTIGDIAFGAQYMNSTDAMAGEIFKYDDCRVISNEALASLLPRMTFYLGVDLAISQKQRADETAIVVVGAIREKNAETKYYVVDTYSGRPRFHEQTDLIKRIHDKWNVIGAGVATIGVEAVAYQQGQLHSLEDTHPEIKRKLKRIVPRKGDDKVTRAHRLTPIFNSGRIFFAARKLEERDDGQTVWDVDAWKLREQLVMFPKAAHDDLFDALDHAITSANARAKAKERSGASDFGVF